MPAAKPRPLFLLTPIQSPGRRRRRGAGSRRACRQIHRDSESDFSRTASTFDVDAVRHRCTNGKQMTRIQRSDGRHFPTRSQAFPETGTETPLAFCFDRRLLHVNVCAQPRLSSLSKSPPIQFAASIPDIDRGFGRESRGAAAVVGGGWRGKGWTHRCRCAVEGSGPPGWGTAPYGPAAGSRSSSPGCPCNTRRGRPTTRTAYCPPGFLLYVPSPVCVHISLSPCLRHILPMLSKRSPVTSP